MTARFDKIGYSKWLAKRLFSPQNTYDAPKENNAATVGLNELADASSQDIVANRQFNCQRCR